MLDVIIIHQFWAKQLMFLISRESRNPKKAIYKGLWVWKWIPVPISKWFFCMHVVSFSSTFIISSSSFADFIFHFHKLNNFLEGLADEIIQRKYWGAKKCRNLSWLSPAIFNLILCWTFVHTLFKSSFTQKILLSDEQKWMKETKTCCWPLSSIA